MRNNRLSYDKIKFKINKLFPLKLRKESSDNRKPKNTSKGCSISKKNQIKLQITGFQVERKKQK